MRQIGYKYIKDLSPSAQEAGRLMDKSLFSGLRVGFGLGILAGLIIMWAIYGL